MDTSVVSARQVTAEAKMTIIPEVELLEDLGEISSRFFIDAEWVLPHSDRTFQMISPNSEAESFRASLAHSRAVAAARDAFDHGPWRHTTAFQEIQAPSMLG
jgi:hypothetical protein